MKKSAQKVWRIVLANLPELPPYPWSNLCEPQYTALLFKRDCTRCAEATLTKMDPYLLVRLCESCRKTELLQVRSGTNQVLFLFSLVCQTPLIDIKLDAAQIHLVFHSPIAKHCLRREFEEIRNAWEDLSQPGNSQIFLKWKDEVHEEVIMRHQFAERLERFLILAEKERWDELSAIKGRLNDDLIQRLGVHSHSAKDANFQWENFPEWRAFEEHPNTLTEQAWKEAIPSMLLRIDAQRDESERLDCETRKKEFYRLLRNILPRYKHQTHPLALIFQGLGFDLASIDAPENAAVRTRIASFLDCYPFPGSSDVMSWSFLADVNEGGMKLPEFEEWFQSQVEIFKDQVHLWILMFEEVLAARQVFGNGPTQPLDPEYDDPDCIVKIRGSIELTHSLPLCTRVLLRADSIFHRLPFDPVEDRDSIVFYPEFLPATKVAELRQLDISGSCFYKHEEGVKIAKKLLCDLEMPDVSYLELSIIGNRFACGRCYFPKPTSWKGLIQHYLAESHAWSLIRSGSPRCKTEHPAQFIHVHDVDSQKSLPCARLLPAKPAPDSEAPIHNPPLDEEQIIMTEDNWPVMGENAVWEAEDEVDEQVTEPVVEESIYCAPCKNYGRMFVTRLAMDEGMGWHLREVHHESSPERGVHFELTQDSKSFLAAGNEWKDRWDAYHDGREHSNGV